MLKLLRVTHLATVESLEIVFHHGLNILTGDTGAGKSILVAALRLALGGRARTELVRTGAEAARVEAAFRVADPFVQAALAERGFGRPGPHGVDLVLTREVSANGRSRALVDGRAVRVSELATLAALLVDVTAQHAHHALVDARTHIRSLDASAGVDTRDMRARWRALQRARAELAEAEAALAERDLRQSRLEAGLKAVDELRPERGELPTLEAELERLSHAEGLASAAEAAHRLLYAADAALVARIARAADDVARMGRHDPALAELGERLHSACLDLQEVARDLGRYAAAVDASPGRLQAVQERVRGLQRLARQHGGDLDAVHAWAKTAREELDALADAEGQRDRSAAAVAAADRHAREEAARLETQRRAAAAELGAGMTRELADLGMPDARVEVSVGPRGDEAAAPELGPDGHDHVEFLLASNPGEAARPLARIASGGELSRALLGLKRVLAAAAPAGTWLFDEIDTGVGGAVADAIGRKLASIAAHHQVLCITHAPQVAAFADRHLQVHKRVEDGRTYSGVTPLDDPARVDELARMLGGAQVTPATRQVARDLAVAAQAVAASERAPGDRSLAAK
jgi:DNA repair protein RecN (Recombination protein N)